MGICYDRRSVRWGDLEPKMYVILPDGFLARLLETHEGAWRVELRPGDAPVVWRAQDPDKMIPVADLHPADPVTLIREMLNATPFAFKRNDEGTWLCAPWREERSVREPVDLFREHLAEFHGIKMPAGTEYERLLEYHTEHHTAGITHPIPHEHPER